MDNGLPRPNTQTMTFVVGRLYVHVRSSVTDVFENWWAVLGELDEFHFFFSASSIT
jgi:hypothetical protein